jgi:hypothetical protein
MVMSFCLEKRAMVVVIQVCYIDVAISTLGIFLTYILIDLFTKRVLDINFLYKGCVCRG